MPSTVKYPSSHSPYNIDLGPTDEDLAALIIMVLIPEMFEPQKVKNKAGDLLEWHSPHDIGLDKWVAQFHANAVLTKKPHLMDTVYRNICYIQSKRCHEDMKKNGKYSFCCLPPQPQALHTTHPPITLPP